MDATADAAAALAAWQGFFSAVAGVAATLVGLLFVALAINPAVMADRGPTGLRTWAAQTFHSFLMLLAVGLIGLIPDPGSLGFGLPLLVLGTLGVVRIISDAAKVRRDPDPEWHGSAVVTRFAAPLLGNVVAGWVGWQAIQGEQAGALSWLIATVFLLMMNAVQNCWDLLREIGDQHEAAKAKP